MVRISILFPTFRLTQRKERNVLSELITIPYHLFDLAPNWTSRRGAERVAEKGLFTAKVCNQFTARPTMLALINLITLK